MKELLELSRSGNLNETNIAKTFRTSLFLIIWNIACDEMKRLFHVCLSFQ